MALRTIVSGDVPRFLRTLGHLRPSQLLWRARYALRRKLGSSPRHAAATTSRTPREPPGLRTNAFHDERCLFEDLGFDPEIVQRLAAGDFDHLGERRRLGRPPDWRLGPCSAGRLWTVNLHYHRWAYELACSAADDGLREEAQRLFSEYIDNWCERCDLSRPGSRDLAWNAYATATRIGWWVRAAHRFGLLDLSAPALVPAAAAGSFSQDFVQRFRHSLWQQADFLSRNVEWDLQGNHLVRDAVGLAWAGRMFEGRAASRWLRSASALAVSQVEEQVLADGGHFERSPMYHAQVADDFAVLYELLPEASVRDVLQTALLRMADFAAWARHPDGDVALFNDASLAAETTPDALLQRLALVGLEVDPSLPRGGRHFPATGLAIWHGSPWTIFFDVGALGPGHQPGHSHADNLSIEASWKGMRLFVDPGTHSYDRDERRRYDRSTAAHNTVCVDETDSSEVWHIFRVGRRAAPRDVVVQTEPASLEASAAHDGYRHRDDITHRRHLRVSDEAPLVVIDHVEGCGRHRVDGGWLLEPGWLATPSAQGWDLRRDEHCLHVHVQGPAGLALNIEARPWHPRFGHEVATLRLCWRWEGPLPLKVTTTVSSEH